MRNKTFLFKACYAICDLSQVFQLFDDGKEERMIDLVPLFWPILVSFHKRGHHDVPKSMKELGQGCQMNRQCLERSV